MHVSASAEIVSISTSYPTHYHPFPRLSFGLISRKICLDLP